MYKVFVADQLAPEGIAALAQYPELEIDFTPGLSVADAIPHARAADAIIVRSATKIKGELLAAADKLKVVGRAGIGVDNVDLDAATERGIVVLNTPDANARPRPNSPSRTLLAVSQLPAADRSVRDGVWERNSFPGTEIQQAIGIIGLGTIGLWSRRCAASNAVLPDPSSPRRLSPSMASSAAISRPCSPPGFRHLALPGDREHAQPALARASARDETGCPSGQLRARRPGRRGRAARTGRQRPSRRRGAGRVRAGAARRIAALRGAQHPVHAAPGRFHPRGADRGRRRIAHRSRLSSSAAK